MDLKVGVQVFRRLELHLTNGTGLGEGHSNLQDSFPRPSEAWWSFNWIGTPTLLHSPKTSLTGSPRKRRPRRKRRPKRRIIQSLRLPRETQAWKELKTESRGIPASTVKRFANQKRDSLNISTTSTTKICHKLLDASSRTAPEPSLRSSSLQCTECTISQNGKKNGHAKKERRKSARPRNSDSKLSSLTVWNKHAKTHPSFLGTRKCRLKL